MRNKLLFVFDQLIAVGVKCGFGYINKDRNLFVHVTLPHHASIALGNIGRPPRTIQVVECAQPRLYVGASAHLLGTAHQHANRTAADFAEQFSLLSFRIGIMDELYLILGDAARHQFVPNIVVHIKAVRAGRAQIAEDHLRGALRLCLFPNGKDPLHAGIRLAVGVIGQKRIHQPLVQRQLAAIIRDAQHVVLIWGNQAVAHRLSPLTQRRHHLPLQLAGRQLHNRRLAARDLGDRQLQHIGGLNVGTLLEHVHKLGQIVKFCKPRFGAVAVSLGGQLNRGNALAKRRGPRIKVQQPLLLQKPVLQIPHHDVHFSHRIGNRCACGKHDAVPAGQLVHVHALHIHVAGLLAFGLGNTGHAGHFGGDHCVFEVVRLVHHQAVHAQLLKGDDVILAALVVELVQLPLQLLFHALHLLDGEILGALGLQRSGLCHYIVNLFLQVHFLPFIGKRYLFKLTVPDHDNVKVACSNAGTELLAVCFFKIRLACHQNFCIGVEQQRLGRHLFGQMVGYYDQRFIAKTQALLLHSAGDHLERFSSPHLMCQKYVAAVQHMGNGVALMGSQRNFRVHAGEAQIAAVVFPRADAVEFAVVQAYQRLPTLWLLENPFFKFVFYQALLCVGSLGGGVVQHAFFVSLCVGNCVKHLHRPQVQRSLGDFIGILAVRAVGDGCLDAAVAVALVCDIPLTGERRKQHLHGKSRGQRWLQQLHEKILNIFRWYPGSTQPHRNLAGVKVLRLYLLQRLHVDLIVRVGRGSQPGNGQLLPHIARKIFVCRQIDRLVLLRVAEDNAGQIACNFFLEFSRDLCHVGKVHAGLLG